MKLSQGVEWGLHCAVGLAQVPEGTLVSARTLAAHYGLPEASLAKHLQALIRSGVLRATPGPNGGFRLAKPADRITVLDVVEAIEGTAQPFRCQEIRRRGTGAVPASACRRPCRINGLMTAAHEAWRASLRQTTVADIAKQLPGGLVPLTAG
jgi:Rrf2 family protein